MSLAALELDGRIATLRLNRPEQRNALSIDLIAALRERVRELAACADGENPPTVLVMRGEGKSFCAGMDLKAVLGDPAAPPKLLRSLAELTLEIRALPAVVIACVHGAAIGGGCGMTCVADVSLTHDDAKIGFPEVDLGVCPAVIAPWVVKKVGPGRARAMLLRGGLMTGAEGAALGLMDQSLPDQDTLNDAVSSLASRVAKGGRRALGATKSLLNDLDGSRDRETILRGATISADVVATAEAQTSLRARFGMD